VNSLKQREKIVHPVKPSPLAVWAREIGALNGDYSPSSINGEGTVLGFLNRDLGFNY